MSPWGQIVAQLLTLLYLYSVKFKTYFIFYLTYKSNDKPRSH